MADMNIEPPKNSGKLDEPDLNTMDKTAEPEKIGKKDKKKKDKKGMNDFNAQRDERDLQELKGLIENHFEQRRKDEADLDDLRTRINNRTSVRAEQTRARQERLQKRSENEKAEALRKMAVEEEKAKAEVERKKELMLIMSMNCGGHQAKMKQQKRGKGGRNEEKKKVLAQRRKMLNVDHLQGEKLIAKANELHEWLESLQAGKYDEELKAADLKEEVKQMRQRINDLTDAKKNAPKKVTPVLKKVKK